jgi:glucose-6-phosphate-specific signal transduction histidine kinase
LRIEDDGTGIRQFANSMRPSFGLVGMQERVSTLGGQMKVVSREGEGTRISITVPLPARAEKPEKHHKAREGSALVGTGTGS